MVKEFMGRDFLLGSEPAQKAFEAAEKMRIFDWHCHLSAKEIFENKPSNDLCELWLSGDHYKWRMMRSAGIDEKYITGDAKPFEKFKAFSKALSLAPGNPLFHWSHLELQRYFGIYDILCEDTAEKIWNDSKAKIQGGAFTPRELILRSNVFALCTTDDPADSLEWHINFSAYLGLLGKAAEIEIDSFEKLKAALKKRLLFFKSLGAVACDQSVAFVPFAPAGEAQVEAVFKKLLKNEKVSVNELEVYKFAVLSFLGKEYAKEKLVMELHLGAMRNNNSRAFASLGADTGFDSIDDRRQAQKLSRFLDPLDKNSLDEEGCLPKTILFALNPTANYVLGSMLGNFQSAEAKSKLQFGSAWWFNDNIDGMTSQLKTLANLGVLGCFVGMLTDSRSFLSYPRHEYFRRILCDLLGSWVEDGLYPYDRKTLEKIVRGICFENAKEYFLS